MKKYLITALIAILLTGSLMANEIVDSEPNAKKGRIDLSFSQGFAWGRRTSFNPIENLDGPPVFFTVKAIGPTSNVGVRLRLTETRFLNLSYARQTNSILINREFRVWGHDTRLLFSDYRLSEWRHFLSLTYDTRLTPNLEFGAGLSYMFWGDNAVGVITRSNPDGSDRHPVIFASTSFRNLRSDRALHLTAFARASVPINQYVELGFRAGLHLGIIGFESVMFLPELRVML